MASEESRIDQLINQCKSNDVDVKVDALAKLQAEFEGGSEIPDVDAILSLFKACLRTSNQHLSNATLNALPSLLPLIIARNAGPLQSNASLASSSSGSSSVIDVPTLRQALSAFLPSGGIIDRLGDKEKAQAKAREALVLLGGYAFRANVNSAFSSKSGKGPETPMMVFERVLKESGLASKVWKIREQSILTLVHLRRAQPQFPIRPFLSPLVDCLEDTDAHVRDCAKTSVIDLFSGPYVTDAARADLKKELIKKNVRKTIVDGVLSKLMAASLSSSVAHTGGSENGDDSSSSYVPPSLMLAGKRPRVPSQGSGVSKFSSSTNGKEPFSRPQSRGSAPSPAPTQAQTPTSSDPSSDVRPVYIASSKDLENEFASMAKAFEGKETEHNWSAREQAVQRVRGMLKGDVHTRYPETFYACLKEGFMQWSLKTLASLRTTVATNTCHLYSELAATLGSGLDPYCDLLLTNLLKMSGFTKKITAQQSQVSVTDIITNTSAPSRVVLPLLWTTLQEKNTQSRSYAIAHLKHYIETHGARAKNSIEATGGLEVLEKSVKKALADPNPAVRETARVMFWSFDAVWHDCAFAMLEALDGTARKQLERACPNPELMGGIASATPKVPKKSSIAAAIAASRAKAKAIANAPPSLRHQATSTSTAQTPVQRPAPSQSLRTSPKSSVARPSSPLRMASTPGSPPSRTPMATSTVRSVSSGTLPMSGSTSRSASGNKRARSPSLSDHQFDPRRRTTSPLATSPSNNMHTLRKAMQTALPASPPSSGQPSPSLRPTVTLRGPPAAANTRQSLMMPLGNVEDESLLMAQTVPIPEGDTDSEGDHSMNLMSFSAAYDRMPPQFSPRSMGSKPTASVSNALSTGSVSDMGSGMLQQPAVVVEDALRARAEQAESAAERLLELVDENDLQEPIVPVPVGVSAMAAAAETPNGQGSTPNGSGTVRAKSKTKPAPIPLAMRAPVTPKPNAANARASAIMKQAAMFQDSPVAAKKTTSLMDVLQAQRHETGWWLKRTALISKAGPLKAKDDAERIQELKTHIAALEVGDITKENLQRVALFCSENTVSDLSSPPPSPGGGSPSPFLLNPSTSLTTRSELWDTERVFDRLFNALMQYLEPSKQEDELEYALIIVWEMLENQGPYLEGREADLFTMLLRVRYCNKVNVLEATSTIRDALTSKSDPVYGLTTFHGCLKTFQLEQTTVEPEVKATTTAFGLIALGKFILRLPAEIAEEELPRLKGTLISALNDRSSLVVRESAAAAIISAQLVLKDETQLFALLDGLADDKKNLLTYLFDKHGARATGAGDAGIAKFQKEIRRLDTRTSTPSRG